MQYQVQYTLPVCIGLPVDMRKPITGMDLSDHYPDVHKQVCLLQILILLSHKLHLEVPTISL